MSRRQARAGEDSAHARGAGRTADLRYRVRSSRRQRRGPLGGGPHPQAAARARPGGRRAPGVAADDLAVRERRPRRALPNGAGVGGERDRAASAPPASAVADHHRSGPDRRPDAWRATAHVLQRALRQLSAATRVPDFQRREVSVRGGARPGKAVAADGTLGLLCRLLPMLRAAFPSTPFLVRLDALRPRRSSISWMPNRGSTRGRAERGVSGMPNPRWPWPARRARPVVTSIPTPEAGTWGHQRRVVIKAEVVRLKGREPRDNPRFVVSSCRARFIYEWVYCARGDIENRIKELLDGLQITARAAKFLANQLRLTAAAYVLMQELARTGCARTQVVAARPAAEAACRRLGAPHRPASTTRRPIPRVAAHRALGACAG